jgi:hypothetical protein
MFGDTCNVKLTIFNFLDARVHGDVVSVCLNAQGGPAVRVPGSGTSLQWTAMITECAGVSDSPSTHRVPVPLQPQVAGLHFSSADSFTDSFAPPKRQAAGHHFFPYSLVSLTVWCLPNAKP